MPRTYKEIQKAKVDTVAWTPNIFVWESEVFAKKEINYAALLFILHFN